MVESLKVLVTGASGLLGEDAVRVFKESGHEVIEVKGREQLDLTRADETLELIRRHKPQIVVHCAGTHDIDGAENDPMTTYLNVVLSTRNVVNACKIVGATLVFPGSDYVFDGLKDKPYIEVDEPNPVNVYGRAKYASEKVIIEILPEHFIVRVPILFGASGRMERNLIYNIYSKIKQGQYVKAPYDQVSSCAYTVDVAKAFEKMVRTYHYGTYHLANSGYCSRYELYKEIALQLGLPADKITPYPSAELDRPAKRPKYTVLSSLFAEKVFGLKLRHWKEALIECIGEFKKRIQIEQY